MDVLRVNREVVAPHAQNQSTVKSLVENQLRHGSLQENGLMPEFVQFFKVCTSADSLALQTELQRYEQDPVLGERSCCLQDLMNTSEELITKLQPINSVAGCHDLLMEELHDESDIVFILELAQVRLAKSGPIVNCVAWELGELANKMKNAIQGLREDNVELFSALHHEAMAKIGESFAEFVEMAIERSMPKKLWDKAVVLINEQLRADGEIVSAVCKGQLLEVELCLRKHQLDCSPEQFEALLQSVRVKCGGDPLRLETLTAAIAALKRSDGKFVLDAVKSGIKPQDALQAVSADSKFMKIYVSLTQIAESDEFERGSERRLTEWGCLVLAKYCADTVPTVQHLATSYISSAKTPHLRDLHFDWTKREVYVIADDKASALQKEGSYKKVRSCAAIRLDCPDDPVEHLAHISIRHDAVNPVVPENITREIPFINTLQHVPGIVKVRSFRHIHAENGAPGNVSMVMKRAKGGTLEDRRKIGDLTVQNDGTPGATLLHIARQMVTTAAEMHRAGVIHCDLKAPNLLVDENDQLVFTDFGLSYSILPSDNGSIIQTSRLLAKKKSYAAWWHTPFEFFSPNERFSLESDLTVRQNESSEQVSQRILKTLKEHLLVESFAIGNMLFAISYGYPDWQITLMNEELYPPAQKVDAQLYNQLYGEYTSRVLDRLAHLDAVAVDKRTAAEHYQYLILKLMDRREQRWLTMEAQDYFKRYFSSEAPVVQ